MIATNSHFKKGVWSNKSCPREEFGMLVLLCPLDLRPGQPCQGLLLVPEKKLNPEIMGFPKENGPINISTSIHLSHIPNAFAKAEAQLPEATVLSRDS